MKKLTLVGGDGEQVEVLTVLEDLADAVPLVLAASVALHVGEDSTLVGPEVVPGAEEENWELPDLVPQVLDVGGDVPGVVDLCRPPPEGAVEERRRMMRRKSRTRRRSRQRRWKRRKRRRGRRKWRRRRLRWRRVSEEGQKGGDSPAAAADL